MSSSSPLSSALGPRNQRKTFSASRLLFLPSKYWGVSGIHLKILKCTAIRFRLLSSSCSNYRWYKKKSCQFAVFREYASVTYQNTITRRGGNTADIMDKVLQWVHPPTTKVKRIPTVRNSWKKAPKAPLIEVSAISPMYIGAATQIPPVIDTYCDLICKFLWWATTTCFHSNRSNWNTFLWLIFAIDS